MRDEEKTREQLIRELVRLRKSLADMEETKSSAKLEYNNTWKVDRYNCKRIFELFPGGISIATDISCAEIRHNPIAAKFLRIGEGESFSHLAPEPPPVKVLRAGKELTREQMPMARSAWYGEEIVGEELELVWEDGTRKSALLSCCPLYGDDGRICGSIGTFQEITHLKELEQKVESQRDSLEKIIVERTGQLAKANEQITQIFESITDGFFAVDKNWRVTYVNQAAENMAGRKKAELLGKNMWEEFFDNPPTFSEKYRDAMTLQKSVNVEGYSKVLQKWVQVDAYPWKDGLTFFLRDITERMKTMEQLRFSEERFAKAFHKSSSAMVIQSLSDNTYVDVNQSFINITGYAREEIIGHFPHELNIWPEGDNQQITLLNNFIQQGSISNVEVMIRTKQGKTRTGLVSSDIIESNGEKYILTVAQDITELRQLQEEVIRLDRLNSMAQLAASISHEVRNPMTTVRGFLQMLKEKPKYAGEKEVFHLMIEELDRANAILSEYLSLSGTRSTKDQKNLNKIVNDLYPLLLGDAIKSDKNILLNQQPVPDLLLNKKEVHQLILNLARNGLEAMQAGGRLIISTYPEGENVVLSVKDEGTGIPADVLANLGTPFLTTKEGGTGMGLAVSYSIATKNNATISVATGEMGTTFYVKFRTGDAEHHQQHLFADLV